MHSCKGICSAIASFTLLLIPGTPSVTFGTAVTPTGMENVGVYSAIAVSVRVDIVCEQVTEIVKDI